MTSKGLLPCSQEPDNGRYPGQAKSSPHHHIPPLDILPSGLLSSGFPIKIPCAYLIAPRVLLFPPISSSSILSPYYKLWSPSLCNSRRCSIYKTVFLYEETNLHTHKKNIDFENRFSLKKGLDFCMLTDKHLFSIKKSYIIHQILRITTFFYAIIKHLHTNSTHNFSLIIPLQMWSFLCSNGLISIILSQRFTGETHTPVTYGDFSTASQTLEVATVSKLLLFCVVTLTYATKAKRFWTVLQPTLPEFKLLLVSS
jgi:hypothetical protein